MKYFVKNSIFNSITYILPVGDTRDCWLVDCGDVEKVIEQGWRVRGVLLTHAHFDHIYGLNKLVEVFPDVLVYTNEEGALGLQNPKWNFSRYHEEVKSFVFNTPENVIVIEASGKISTTSSRECVEIAREDSPQFLDDVEALFSSGHEPSCISYRIGDRLFTGDAYIPGVKVVTTFPRSNKQLAAESLARLQELGRLGLKVMPGHWIEKNEG